MKKIYIVLTYTGTILSRIIKTYTKDEFSHSSISMDLELKQMYSFGRLNPYNPFWGGFVHEGIGRGTFKRFRKTRAKIYELKVTDNQYEEMVKTIKLIDDNKEKYKFNILGLFAAGFHKKISEEKSFYCAEFVKYIIEKAGIKTNLPEIIKPEDFKSLEGLEQIYDGLLRKYKVPKSNMNRFVRNELSYR